MKGLSATSARAKTAPRLTGQSSARPQHTRTSADEFALTGPSDLPDPQFNAYRKDLADIELAGRVISSHYAVPVERRLAVQTMLRSGPAANAESIGELTKGELFLMLDDNLGWAWGYAGEDKRVGYVPADSLYCQ